MIDSENDLNWIREQLEKATKKLRELENEWQNSGYGSRSAIARLNNKIRLCNIALRGLKQDCYRCELRWRNIRTTISTLEAEKKTGVDMIDIDRAIDLIKAIY